MGTFGGRKRVRFTLDVTFTSEGAKEAYVTMLNATRTFLMPKGADKVDNHRLLCSLLSLGESSHQQLSQEQCTEQSRSIASETQIESTSTGAQTTTTGNFFVIWW